MAGNIPADSNLRIRRLEAKATMDGLRACIWAPLFYRDANYGTRLPDFKKSSEFKGAIKWYSDVASRKDGGGYTAPSAMSLGDKGDLIYIPHWGAIQGAPVYGDARVRGSETPLDLASQTLYAQIWAKAIETPGPLTKLRSNQDFEGVFMEALKTYTAEFVEESVGLLMYGLTSQYTTAGYQYTKLTVDATHLQNTVETFDSSTIVYPGTSATSQATLTIADTLNMNAIAKAQLRGQTGTFPLENLREGGSAPIQILIAPSSAKRDLLADPAFRDSQTKVLTVGQTNELQRWQTLGYDTIPLGNLLVVFNPRAPYAGALETGGGATDGYVARSLLMGADAALAYMPNPVRFAKDVTDYADLRHACTVVGQLGLKANKVNGIRRGCIAIDHAVSPD